MKCGVRSDDHNSQKVQYSSVPTFSKGVMHNGVLYRVSLIGNSRRSIDQAIEKLKVHGPYIEYARMGYDIIPDHQKFLDQESMKTESKKINCIPSFPAQKK